MQPSSSWRRLTAGTGFSVGGQGSDTILKRLIFNTASAGASVAIYENAPSGSTATSRAIGTFSSGSERTIDFDDLRAVGGVTVYASPGGTFEAVVIFR